MSRTTRLQFAAVLTIAICIAAPTAPSVRAEATACAGTAASLSAPRERLSINDGWRFQKDDPPGNTVPLLYDVRPELKDPKENQVADARPEEAERLSSAGRTVLKPWILPTGNAFIKDPIRRHARPEGDPGAEVSYVQAGFDDSTWRQVDLPHDWAIAGPFLETGDFGGMGRLRCARRNEVSAKTPKRQQEVVRSGGGLGAGQERSGLRRDVGCDGFARRAGLARVSASA